MSGILLLVELTEGFDLRYTCDIFHSFTEIYQHVVHVDTQGKEIYEKKVMQIFRMEPGIVSHLCNPRTQETEAG